MKHTATGDDLPRLLPDTNIRCDFKNQLKRCSDEELIFLEGVYHLVPDARLTMPDRHRLKRTATKRFPFTVASIVAAVAAVAIPFAALKNTHRPLTPAVRETLVDSRNAHPETNVANGTAVAGAVAAGKTSAGVPKLAARRNPAQNSIRNVATANSELTGRRTLEPLSGIALPEVLATTAGAWRIVPRYTHVEQESKSIFAELAEQKLNDVRTGKLPVFSGLAGLLKHRSETDRYIQAWLDNNRDVSFDIYAEVTNEDRVTEIYDEAGTLVKAIFVTSSPVNYGRASAD
jgi:hypothetical protein